MSLAACATSTRTRPSDDPIGGAFTQPLKDLSMIREAIPETLARAASSPYETESPSDCGRVAEEIAKLDALLGPDVDAADATRGAADDLVSDAVRGALGLPFRGVIRQLSGAAERDRAHAKAVLAGMVRRGYLKGLRRGRDCASTVPAGEQGPR